jgi:hypothetical protein
MPYGALRAYISPHGDGGIRPGGRTRCPNEEQWSTTKHAPGLHRPGRPGGTVVSAGERTGWRDQELSRRHRRWGFACPAVDLDFVLVEFGLAAPVALVEYKHFRARPVDLEHPTYRALQTLADREPAIPFLVARYWPESWAFSVQPANATAQQLYGCQRHYSEAEFVATLYELRAATIQHQVLRHLNRERPPASAAA